MQGALPVAPTFPNMDATPDGIVGSTKIGSVGKSVRGGGGAPPVPPMPPIPTSMRPPMPPVAVLPPVPPGFPVPAAPVGYGDDPTFAQASAQVPARMTTLRLNALQRLLVLLITTNRRGRLVKSGKYNNRIRQHLRQPTARLCNGTTVVRRSVGSTEYSWEYRRKVPFVGRADNRCSTIN